MAGPGDTPKPIASVAPGTGKVNPIPVIPTKELNCIAKFDWDPPISGADEINELTNDRWAPGTADFTAVVGRNTVLTESFGSLLAAIFSEKDKSVKRVNLFTHANPDLIGFRGRIQKATLGHASVFMDTNDRTQNDNLTAMDPISMNNLNQPGVFFFDPKNPKTQITVDAIRKKFAEDAVFVLYGCNSGQVKSFIDSIAKFFQIKVIGFKQQIRYIPPPQTNPKVFLRVGEKIGLGLGNASNDFHDLTQNLSDPGLLVSTP